MPLLEAQASNAAKAVIDMMGSVICIMTDTIQPVRLVAKYKPGACIRRCVYCSTASLHAAAAARVTPTLTPLPLCHLVGVPLVVLTNKRRVATQCALLHGANPVVLKPGLDTSHNNLLQTVGGSRAAPRNTRPLQLAIS